MRAAHRLTLGDLLGRSTARQPLDNRKMRIFCLSSDAGDPLEAVLGDFVELWSMVDMELVNAATETTNHRWSAVSPFADPLKMEIQ
jgi:hypothetical protein